MSKQAGTTKNISTTGPMAAQQPFINEMLNQAYALYSDKNAPNYWPGPTVTEFAPAETLGRNVLSDYASGIAAPMAERTQQSLERVTGGDYLDVGNNPLVQNVVKASTQNVLDQLTREALPAIRSGAQLAGQFGGTRQGLAEGLAIGEAAKAATQAGSQINLGAYNTAMNNLMQGLQLAPSVQQMGYVAPEMLSAVGGQERAMEQAKLNEQIARFQYEQNLPYIKLAEYANLVRSPLGGTSETYTTYPETPAGQQIAGGIMTALPAILQLINLFK